jgi:hypothetical protein
MPHLAGNIMPYVSKSGEMLIYTNSNAFADFIKDTKFGYTDVIKGIVKEIIGLDFRIKVKYVGDSNNSVSNSEVQTPPILNTTPQNVQTENVPNTSPQNSPNTNTGSQNSPDMNTQTQNTVSPLDDILTRAIDGGVKVI